MERFAAHGKAKATDPLEAPAQFNAHGVRISRSDLSRQQQPLFGSKQGILLSPF